MSEIVIETKGLTRRFGELVAVDKLDLQVTRGEVFGFLGHNGAGKTTTVRLLNGVLGHQGGKVRVMGLDPIEDGPALRRRTGVLTESPSLDERMTARENLRVYAELYDVPKERVKRRIEELLGQFELEERGDERVGGYSKGMKQRLALARALIHDPELVYLDEPTSGLDPIAAKGVRELIQQLSARGHSVFLATHNLVEAERLCDRVAVLEHGRLLAQGAPHELAERYSHRQRVEVETEAGSLDAARRVLEGLRGVKEIETQTVRVQALLSFSGLEHARVPEAIQALSSAGVPIYRVTPLEASLEDVYFAIHGDNGEASK